MSKTSLPVRVAASRLADAVDSYLGADATSADIVLVIDTFRESVERMIEKGSDSAGMLEALKKDEAQALIMGNEWADMLFAVASHVCTHLPPESLIELVRASALTAGILAHDPNGLIEAADAILNDPDSPIPLIPTQRNGGDN